MGSMKIDKIKEIAADVDILLISGKADPAMGE